MRSTPRIEPTPKLAWIFGLLYAPAFITLLITIGGDYDEIADSTDNLIRAVVIPLAVLTVLLVVLISWLGWWRLVLFDDRPTPRWMRVIPVVVLLGLIAANVADADRSADLETSFLIWAIVGTLLVGFCEESVYRGLAVVGFRSGHREVHVWLYSSLLFGALHLWNFVAGQDIGPTIYQFVFTFVLGSVFYVIRRATGTIIVPMLLHALWDWTSFVGGSEAFVNPAEATDSVGGAFAPLGGMIAVVLCLVGLKKLFVNEVDEPATPSSSSVR